MTFHFGGQNAAFVWAAYGLTVPVIVAMVIDSVLKARRWRRAVEAQAIKPTKPQDPA